MRIARTLHGIVPDTDLLDIISSLGAKDEKACDFYERESFRPFPDQPMKLFRPMTDIRRLFE